MDALRFGNNAILNPGKPNITVSPDGLGVAVCGLKPHLASRGAECNSTTGQCSSCYTPDYKLGI